MQRGPHLSLLVALDSIGLIAAEVNLMAYNGVYFARFLKNKLFPKLRGPRTIVMDNCRIHKTQSVKKAFDASQHAVSQRSATAAKSEGWLKKVDRSFRLARANMPLGRFVASKHTLHLLKRGPDPYTKVERDNMEGEDQEEETEGEEFDEVFEEKETFSESSSHSSNTSEDEVNDERDEDEEREVEADDESENEEEEEEEEEEQLYIKPTRPRYSLRNVKALS
ncbi:hypothetical protein BG015_008972 [Linnemannia schmuckeri]|uniref:Tc1-like transposase DDE domain-containing protein n=1 Tax=Linnemannia schmuckeri TaxID=64567 RepID=A0A9P5V9P4_9FUNG|nr:hypothetical protein BG015_008972 [Linnemannia schmuckeri]